MRVLGERRGYGGEGLLVGLCFGEGRILRGEHYLLVLGDIEEIWVFIWWFVMRAWSIALCKF